PQFFHRRNSTAANRREPTSVTLTCSMTNEARRRPRRASAIAFACAVVLTAAPAAAQTRAPEATLFRVFLTDGTTLVSYGEYARVADERRAVGEEHAK